MNQYLTSTQLRSIIGLKELSFQNLANHFKPIPTQLSLAKMGVLILYIQILILSASSTCCGQITENFNGAALPSGWAEVGSPLWNVQTCEGAGALGFNGSGDGAITPSITNPNKLNFDKKRSGAATAWVLLIQISDESPVSQTSGPWTTVVTVTSIGATCSANPEIDLSIYDGLRYVRFIDNRPSGGNERAIDNVAITVESGGGSSSTDFFRSNVASGTWSTPASWQSSPTGNDPWITATLAPTSASSGITVRNGHTITANASVTVNQTVIESGGTVDVTGGTFTVDNEPGTDLEVNGILKASSVVTTSSGTIVIKNGGKYQHNYTSTVGVIPTATWESGSTCEIIGYTTATGFGSANLGQSFHHFTWNCPNQTVETNLNGTLTSIAGNFNVENTGSSNVRMIGSASTLTVGGNLAIGSSGTLNMSGTTQTLTINLSGNLTVNGTLTELSTGSGLVVFTGTNNQTFSGTGTISNTVNFTVSKSAGTVQLGSSISLPNNLTLTTGKIDLGSFNLTIAGAISGPTWGSTTTSYIVAEGSGELRKTTPSSFIFPVGTSSAYMPCRLSGGTGTFGVNVSDPSSGIANPSQVLNHQWNINGGTGPITTAEFQWPVSEQGANFNLTSNKSLFRYTSSWAAVSSPASPSGSDPRTASFSSVPCCSGYMVGASSALPIELMSFSGEKAGVGVLLNWRTLLEINNAYFSIERSADGARYTEIGQVPGAGTSTELNEYTYTDEKPLSGVNYYRLRQVDFDGQFAYSPVVSVVFGSTDARLLIAPSPASDDVTVQLTQPTAEPITWAVYDQGGRLVLQGTAAGEIEQFGFNVGALAEGFYILQVTNGREVMTERFQKR